MGLGKTIQILSLLLSIYHKSGLASIDKTENKKKERGMVVSDITNPIRHPCLIITPKSVIKNWEIECHRWGYFILHRLNNTKNSDIHGMDPEDVLQLASESRIEIVLCTYHTLVSYASKLSNIQWEVIIYDEGHELRGQQTKRFKAAMKLSKARCRIILSGTYIQNKLEELWSLLTIVTYGNFNDISTFKSYFVNPIKRKQKRSANEYDISVGEMREIELYNNIISKFILQRFKKDVLCDILKGKDDYIIFCELSPLQEDLYSYLLSLPDFDNVRYMWRLCPCGSQLKRSQCCQLYIIPYKRIISNDGKILYENKIDPRAVIWRSLHPSDVPCDKCPSCVILPCLAKLLKVVSHPSLLQASAVPCFHSDARHAADAAAIQFFNDALSPELQAKLGGPRRSADLLSACRSSLSGKLLALYKLLGAFTSKLEKTLVFSQSTQTLDILEAFIRSKGWSYERLDGSTQESHRQLSVDKFNRDAGILVFLISTKAGGLGLNLTSASKVVIFDCNWNPSLDMQAQDRAYRFGQLRRVSVYRLVAQGTVEEVCYMRQLYKQALQQAASGDGAGHRYFEGIEGDR